MDVVQFQEKLREICDLGKQNGKLLTHEQIREHFASTDLETSQMVKVLQYLKLQGITIEGEENAAQAEEAAGEAEAQPNGTKTPLTPEEEAYLCTVEQLEETAKAHDITKTALIIVGDIVAHQNYGKSRLYAPDFETEFRKIKKSREKE